MLRIATIGQKDSKQRIQAEYGSFVSLKLILFTIYLSPPLSHSAFNCFECLFFASRVSSADKINCQCLSQCQKLYWEHNICYWTYTMCMLDFFFVQLCLQNWLHMFGQCSTIHNSYSFGSGSAWERYVSWFLKVLSMSVWRIFRDKTLPKNSIHIFLLLSS